jgi:hypothetical protein
MENRIAIIETIKDTQVAKTLEAINRFQAVVKSQFKDKHHYGIIPGTGKKPTLLKPGAEVIVTLLGLSTEFTIETCTRDFENEFFDYVIKCTLKHNGEHIAEGLGSANNKETKFVRDEGKAAGMDNNVLKMAKKRALVDAALQVGSLSDVFTQDFDDLPQEDLTGNTAAKNTAENQLEKVITTGQAKRMFAVAKGNVELVRTVMSNYGYERSEQVKVKDYDKIISDIENGVVENG